MRKGAFIVVIEWVQAKGITSASDRKSLPQQAVASDLRENWLVTLGAPIWDLKARVSINYTQEDNKGSVCQANSLRHIFGFPSILENLSLLCVWEKVSFFSDSLLRSSFLWQQIVMTAN